MKLAENGIFPKGKLQNFPIGVIIDLIKRNQDLNIQITI